MHFSLTLAVLLAVLASALAFDGDGTYYNVGLGVCGQYNNNNQLVAALNKPQFGSSPGGNPNHNPNCGRQALVHGPKGQVRVTIVDMCPACGWGSLDLSPSAFSQIADMAQGRVHITWDWMEQSRRVRETAESGVNMAIPYLKGGPDDLNMAQGMVYWTPPAASLQEVLAQVPADVHKYGPIEGLPALREALLKKCRERNGIEGKEIHITCGGNQAFMSVVMTVCDAGDEVVIFTPYYFNHLMALQLINAKAVLAPCRPDDLTPDLSVLPSLITPKTKAIVLISPNNPTGAITPPETIQKIQQLCLDKGLWLIVDEAYEDFVFDGATHRSPTGPNVINIFTFSKSYGLAGWRVGYVLFPPELKEGMDKVQDTVPINACQISQRLALHALTSAGPQWVAQMVATLQRNRELAWDAVEPLRTHHERQGRTAPGMVRTQGSLYVFAKLPEGVDDMAAIKYLSHQHKVCVLPGKGFGAPGHLRVSFGNLPPEVCEQAALRLKQGLQEIVDGKLSL